MPGEDDSFGIRRGVSRGGYASAPTAEEPVSDAARATMRANRRRDTGPELAVRRIVHRAGLRFRVDHPLPFDRRKRADIAFTKVGLYVFIDGCFWHGCPEHFILPKTRTEFWKTKIDRNRERDSQTDAELRNCGLHALRFWEHAPSSACARLIIDTYRTLSG